MKPLSISAAPEAAEAIDLFAWRAAREIAALAASLGGLDGLVFTAGIGEKHADMRARIARRLEWLGLRLDEAANAVNATHLSTPDSRVRALVIPTDEALMIALHTLRVVREAQTAPSAR